METPSFASNARFSAELMESTSTDAAVTAEAATTEGAAGGWWSATAAAAVAAAASAAAPAATTAAWHAARAGTRRVVHGVGSAARNVAPCCLPVMLDRVHGRDEDGVDGRLDVVAVHGAPHGRDRVGVGDDDEVGLRLRQGLGHHHVRLGGQDLVVRRERHPAADGDGARLRPHGGCFNTARRHKRPDTSHNVRLPGDVDVGANRGAKHTGVQARRGRSGDVRVEGSLCGPSSCTSWRGGRAGGAWGAWSGRMS